MKPLTLLLVALAILVAACHKPLEPAVVHVTTSDTTFNLANTTSLDLQISIYTSSADLLTLSNEMVSRVVPAGGINKIPARQVDTAAGTNYYCHYATPDHHYTNWGSYHYPLPWGTYQDVHTVIINGSRLTQASWYFLHDNEQSTSWIAVDRLGGSGESVWALLATWQRYFHMTIGRNQQLTAVYQLPNGELETDIKDNVDVDTLGYSGVTTLQFYNSSGSSRYFQLYNISHAPGAQMPAHTSRDTICVSDGSDFWLMKRQ